MTTIEIKHRIRQVIDELPEDKLNDVLIYISGLKAETVISDERKELVDKIIQENYNLFKRLAQ